jgi:hypothetical protein
MEFMPSDDQWRKYFGFTPPSEDEKLNVGDCTCHLYCGNDSHSGTWHTHEGDPCPLHPHAPVVG